MFSSMDWLQFQNILGRCGLCPSISTGPPSLFFVLSRPDWDTHLSASLEKISKGTLETAFINPAYIDLSVLHWNHVSNQSRTLLNKRTFFNDVALLVKDLVASQKVTLVIIPFVFHHSKYRRSSENSLMCLICIRCRYLKILPIFSPIISLEVSLVAFTLRRTLVSLLKTGPT